MANPIPRLTLALLLAATMAPAQDPYGQGFPGAGGIVPKLGSTQAWMGNAGFGFTLSRGLGGATAFLAISTQPGSSMVGQTEILVSTAPAHLAAVEPLLLSGPASTPGAGAASLAAPLNIPVIPALAGLFFFAQGFVVDFSQGSIAASPGLAVELTYPPALYLAAGSDHQVLDLSGAATTVTVPATGARTGAAFGRGGRDLFVSQSSEIVYADLTAPAPAFTPIYSVAGTSCQGVAYDDVGKVVYTLADPGQGTGSQELVALDGDPASPTFGALIAHTVGLVGGNAAERWALSPSGRIACVIRLFTNRLKVVDTDPASPTFMQQIADYPIPGPGFYIPLSVSIGPGDEIALVTFSTDGATVGRVGRIELATGVWVDHNSALFGIQHIGPQSLPAVTFGPSPWGIQYAATGEYAAVVGGYPVGAGWAGRLDLDPDNPAFYAFTHFSAPFGLTSCRETFLSRDHTQMAVRSVGGSSTTIALFDVASGALTASPTLTGTAVIFGYR